MTTSIGLLTQKFEQEVKISSEKVNLDALANQLDKQTSNEEIYGKAEQSKRPHIKQKYEISDTGLIVAVSITITDVFADMAVKPAFGGSGNEYAAKVEITGEPVSKEKKEKVVNVVKEYFNKKTPAFFGAPELYLFYYVTINGEKLPR